MRFATYTAQLVLISCDHLRYTKDRQLFILIGDHALRDRQRLASCHLSRCEIEPSIWVEGDMRKGNTRSIQDSKMVWLLNDTPRRLHPIPATLTHALTRSSPDPLG